MSASILDPRMIDPSKPLTITNTILTNTTATNVITPGGTSNLWNQTYSVVSTLSSSWEESADITAISTLVGTNSAGWNQGSGSSTVVQSGSANWNQAYNVSTVVQNNSASWEETADILPTVTDYLSTSNVIISALEVLNGVRFIGDVTIYGTLTALSGFQLIAASTTTTSALSVSNIQPSPALDVFQGVASPTIAIFKNNTGEVVSIKDIGITTTGILSTNNTGNSNLWNLGYTTSLSSNLWNDVYTNVRSNSASWEESADILPTVTNYLSTNSVLVSGITVTGNVSATGTIYSANTLTTSICAMSGNGITPFTMQFTNGLLTSITF